MDEDKFISITSLICEPSRAKILWNLLDGRSYTANELATVSDLSATSVSNHLSKLLKGDILKVDVQGRHRYYSFFRPEIAYAIESLANLVNEDKSRTVNKHIEYNGTKYCRTCYDHLAGYVGVTLVEAMEKQGYLEKSENVYLVTRDGWQWFLKLDILESRFIKSRRPLTRQCLDWSMRRPHLAGQLGAAFLDKMIQNKWFKRVNFSREMIITSKGSQWLYDSLGITLI